MAQHICPHCGAVNEEDDSTIKKVANAYLPPLVGAYLTAEAYSRHKGLAILTGGAFTTYSIVHYLNGKKITCGNCMNHYSA